MALLDLFKYERCEDWLFNCPFSTQPDDCVTKFCNGTEGIDGNFGTCTQDFPTAGGCCSKSNPAACLATYQANLNNDTEKLGNCGKIRSALISCDLVVSGFANAAPQTQASCLCYSSGTYNPSVWDNAATSCYASGSSAHPVLYSILTAQNSEALGFCTKYAGPAAVSAETTTVVETQTENGSMTVVTTTMTVGIGGSAETGSTTTVTTPITSGTTTSTTSAAPGTAVSGSGSSSTKTGATTAATTLTTSGSERQYSGLKLKLGIVGLLFPSILMAAFA